MAANLKELVFTGNNKAILLFDKTSKTCNIFHATLKQGI